MNSKRFRLNKKDTMKWLKNAAIFLAPAALLFVISIQAGKTWKESLNILYLWTLNIMVDILRKFIANNK